MHFITLDSETDFDGWRKAARTLVLNEVQPADVTWRVQGDEPELFEPHRAAARTAARHLQRFRQNSSNWRKSAILHRDPERFAILYRLLWRLRSNHDLLSVATDPDVAQVAAMAKAVHRDEHKMHAFVRFREIGREQKSHYVAWFEPEHHIVELAAPFFARRFADMPWSILTPDVCAHWDGHAVSFTPGVAKTEAPTEDRLEETWRRYYASIFNPARLKVKAMQTEMPKKYWRNLPEASLIKPLIASAERTTRAMIANAATEPHKSQKRPEPLDGTQTASRRTRNAARASSRLPRLSALEGRDPDRVRRRPANARSHAGRRAARRQGRPRRQAVRRAGRPDARPRAGRGRHRPQQGLRHQRGKTFQIRAARKNPPAPESRTRPRSRPAGNGTNANWLSIKPDLVVAMGATAAQSVFGKITPINKNRGRLIDLDDGIKALVTVHPSYLLRLPDADAKAREYQRFVDDLKIAAALLQRSARAA